MRCFARRTARRAQGASGVLERRRAQLGFADGLIAQEVTDLREAWMAHADAVSGDEEIVAANAS